MREEGEGEGEGDRKLSSTVELTPSSNLCQSSPSLRDFLELEQS